MLNVRKLPLVSQRTGCFPRRAPHVEETEQNADRQTIRQGKEGERDGVTSSKRPQAGIKHGPLPRTQPPSMGHTLIIYSDNLFF